MLRYPSAARRRRVARVRRAASSLLLGAALGCATSPSPPPPPPAIVGESAGYVIGVRDVLQISVWQDPELGIRALVRSDGMISVPLLDELRAEGLTPRQLQQVLTEELSEYVTDPVVTVAVVEMRSHAVSVLGGVVRSGEVPLQRDMRVLQAIAQSGGFTRAAKRDEIRILRPTRKGLVEYRFDYEAYLAGRAPKSNFALRPGDTIVVPD